MSESNQYENETTVKNDFTQDKDEFNCEHWYVIQVQTGHEEKVIKLCEQMIPPALYDECFLPRCERMLKKEKKWSRVRQILFPGYVFVITRDIDELRPYFTNVPELTKLLGVEAPFPLPIEEVEFLKKFGREEHVVEVSTGMIVNDQVIITEGPMQDFEGRIKRIDRHKRIAVIEVKMFDRVTDVIVGMEIVSKSTEVDRGEV